MYKARFKAWGLTKNLRSHEAMQLKTMAREGEAAKLPTIRGRQIGSKRFKRHLHYVQSSVATGPPLHRRVAFRVSSPLSGRVRSPDPYRSTESCIEAVMNFTRNRFETQSWDLSGHQYVFDADAANSWWLDVEFAIVILEKGRDQDKAFALLRAGFARYDSVVLDQNPTLILAVFWLMLRLSGMGTDLAEMLLHYVADMSAVKLGSNHPIARLWATLDGMGFEETRRMADSICLSYFDMIEPYARRSNWFLGIQRMQLLRYLTKHAGFPIQTTMHIANRVGQQLRANRINQMDDEWETFTRIFASAIYLDMGMLETGLANLDTISLESVRTSQNRETYGKVKGKILRGLGRYEEATHYFEGALQAVHKRMHPDLFQEMLTLHELQNHYILKGDAEAAASASARFDTSWDALMTEIMAGKLHRMTLDHDIKQEDED